MATQLRVVPFHIDQPIVATIAGLAGIRRAIHDAIPEAEVIDLTFQDGDKLFVEIKTTQREARDSIMFRITGNMVPGMRFGTPMPTVERGTRRRLMVVVELLGER